MSPLRCVYTDLDGTLLGRYGSLFRDSEGEFSMLQARALEACHRAGVEVVIKSGRREASVLEDARLIGSTAYIYEVGCAVVIDGEKTVLVGDAKAEEGKTLAETIVDQGVPEMLFDHFAGRLEWLWPWHRQREHSLLFRGKVDVAEGNRLLAYSGHEELRLIDNGAATSASSASRSATRSRT
jgi:hydroxymethylpyrimidine pyrophosphatase-like HAD family hydrolase